MEEEGDVSEQTDDFIEQLETDNNKKSASINKLQTALSSSSYQDAQDPNLIAAQIDTGAMLEKIEHFLKGDYVAIDENGDEYWAKQTDKKLVLFNSFGVNSIMSILGNYIDKNTILSDYQEERIFEILADLGEQLSKFIFCNYEKMGMDTEFKKTRYELTVLTILHSVESTYRRALRGKTAESINSSKILTQLETLRSGQPMGNSPIKKKFNPLSPKTW